MSTAGPVMLDEPHGRQALTVVAFDVWAIGAGVQRADLAANVAAWVAAGRPSHPMLDRMLAGLRAYVARVGAVPSWVPPSLLEALQAETPIAGAASAERTP